jgi:hypothetical protein
MFVCQLTILAITKNCEDSMSHSDTPQALPSDAHAGDPLMREQDVAPLLTVTVKTLQAWRVSGNGPRFIKLGSGLRSPVRYRRSDLLKFLSECERGSTSEHSVAEGR